MIGAKGRAHCWLATAIVAVADLASAATYAVPGDFGTIQEAIDATVAGDSVLVAPGTYTGQLHTGLVCVNVLTQHVVADLKPGITLKSVAGPEVTILDGEPVDQYSVRTVRLVNTDGPPTLVEGFTITGGTIGVAVGCMNSEVTLRDCILEGNGDAALDMGSASVRVEDCEIRNNVGGGNGAVSASAGGRLHVERTVFDNNQRGSLESSHAASVTIIDCEFVNQTEARAVGIGQTQEFLIRGCTFLNNSTPDRGTAITIGNADGPIEFCTFAYNTSGSAGGAIEILGSTSRVQIRNNTFYRCAAASGSAVSWAGWRGAVERNIVVECSSPALRGDPTNAGCNLMWGMEAPYSSTWPEEFIKNDLVGDPLFCDPENLDFTVHSSSPAAAQNSPTCGQIGAFGVGCGSVSVEPTTWGRLKAAFRGSEEQR